MDFRAIEQILALPRVRISRMKQTNDKIYLWLYIPEGQHICPQCGQYHHHVEASDEITVRDLSILGKECHLLISRGLINCSCSFKGYEQIEFINSLQPVTNRFAYFSLFYYDTSGLFAPQVPGYPKSMLTGEESEAGIQTLQNVA